MRMARLRKELPEAVPVEMLRTNYKNRQEVRPFPTFLDFVRDCKTTSDVVEGHAVWSSTPQKSEFWGKVNDLVDQ